eukprot:scaffold41079_cov211-Skeletonema_dohrnii-CCMP3373.AAC.1
MKSIVNQGQPRASSFTPERSCISENNYSYFLHEHHQEELKNFSIRKQTRIETSEIIHQKPEV